MYQVPRLLSHRALAALSIAAILTSFVCLPVASAATRLKAKPGPAQADKRGQDDPKSDTGSGTSKEPSDDKASETETLEIRETHNGAGGTVASRLAPGTTLDEEVEPNGTSATATPIAGSSARMRGNIFGNGDLDFYAFSGTAGDRVYASVMTSFSATASTDSVVDLFQPDGTTVLENDDDNGSLGALSSSIAGAALTMTGTHFIRVRHFSATNQLRPYDLHFQLRSGSPTAETEVNDTFPGQVIPASGWISGSTSATTDVDFFAISLNAGDTVFLSLDLDPERDVTEGNMQLGLGAFGTPTSVLVVNDAGAVGPDSEALFMTVRAAGTYGVFVGVPGGGSIGTYNLSVTVFPRTSPGTCTTYTSTNVPVAIPTGPAVVTSTLTVPGNPRIDKLRVNINLTHTAMADLDVELTSPDGSTIGLFSDIGSAAQTTMDVTLDDDAAIPIGQFTVVQGPAFTPELAYRIGWRNGTLAGGTWTLTIRDDTAANGGTLSSWSLEICEDPQPLCGGLTPNLVFSADFEAGDFGFTSSGTQNEWERGLPTFAPVTGANSGTNAFKTDLDSMYNASSSQDLLSPNIVLPATGPIRLSWAQKYQIENATFDNASVTIREVGNPGNSRIVWQWLDATMTNTVGSPPVTVQEAAGWGLCQRDISDFAGLTVEVVFRLASDTTVQLAGWAIDDVLVESCNGCVITCPANVVQANDAGLCSAVVNYPPPTGSMDCGPIICTPASGSIFAVGTTTVTCMEDILQHPEGNPIPGCSFTVTVQDTEAPAITCPANITQSNDANQCGAVVTYAAPTVSDNCPGVGTPVCTPTSGSFFPVGTTTVMCTVADASPDSVDGTCSFTVTVNDTQPPTITCPANVTQGNDANQCGAVVNFPAPTASDNCPGVGVVCTPAAGSFFPVGTTSVSCTATDASGNTATCGFTVTVNDTQAPTITCPANIVTSGTATATCALSGVVNYPAPTVSDNCPGVGVPVCVPASGSTFPEGTTTVNCMVTDAVGNTATCSFTVTVTSVGAFGACAVDDFSGDTWSIVTDPNSPIFRFWRYRVALTGEVFCGTASAMAFIPNRSLTASDTDDPRFYMNANLNYGARAGTVKVVDQATARQFVIKDRNLNNNPPCQ